jgi:hypothetical protein
VEEDNLDVSYRIRASFNLLPGLYRVDGDAKNDELKWEQIGGTVADTIKSFNAYYETAGKPAGLRGPPCFIDWIDSNWPLPPEDAYYSEPIDFEENVRSMGILYYGGDEENEDETGAFIHIDALEPSARNVYGTNNYTFPIFAQDDEEVMNDLRLRLHIAPNTVVSFSSNGFLNAMGFDNTQYGPRKKYNRFNIENPFKDRYLTIAAENSPNVGVLLTRLGDRVSISSMERIWASRDVSCTMSIANFRQNREIEREVNNILDEIASETNFDVDLKFDLAQKTFSFIFPDNPNMKVTLHLPKELANRLGFGSGVTRITRESIAESVGDYTAVTDAELLSKTLVYDTGMVIVTLDNLSSMSTLGMSEFYMACLRPTSDGTIELRRTTDLPPSIYLPSSGGSNTSQVLCNIWVYNEDGTTRRIDWKTGLYVAGILQGKV